MSLWTDFRNKVEDSVGIGPNSDTAQTLADTVSGIGRTVGQTVTAPSSSPAPSSAPPASVVQKVSTFASGNQNTLLLVAGALALFLVLKRSR